MDFKKLSITQLRRMKEHCKYNLMNEEFKNKRPVGFSALYVDTLKNNMLSIDQELKLRGEDI